MSLSGDVASAGSPAVVLVPQAALSATPFTLTPARQVALLVLAFTLLRLTLMFQIGLGVDESYTLTIAHGPLALSYFDHPPLHVWLAHYAEALFGDGRLARLPFVLLSAGTSWLMYRLTARLFGPRAGVLAVLALNVTIFFGVVASSWILPDGPLNFFLLASAVLFAPIALGDDRARTQWSRWLGLGLCLGLAGLSKYHAVLFALGLIGYVAATPRLRSLFARPQPYAAMALALVMVSPVLLWNAQHHWASFVFQGARAGVHGGLHGTAPLVQLAGQLLLLAPWVFVPLLLATRRALRDPEDAARLCLWLGAPTVLFFTLSALWCGRGMIHWSMPGWLLLLPLLGRDLARRSRTAGRWAASSLALFLLVSAGASAEVATGWLGSHLPRLFRAGDPTVESIEWSALRDELAARGDLDRPGLAVTALDWREGGKIGQALDGALPVTVFSEDPRGFAFLPQPRLGGDSLIIADAREAARAMPGLARYYASVRETAPIMIGRDGRAEIRLRVFQAHDLLRPYPRPYGR